MSRIASAMAEARSFSSGTGEGEELLKIGYAGEGGGKGVSGGKKPSMEAEDITREKEGTICD